MQNNHDLSNGSIFGVFTVSALALFGVFYASRSNTDKQSQINSKLTIGQNFLDEKSQNCVQAAIDRYADLIAQSNRDIDIILEAVDRNHLEIQPYIKDRQSLVIENTQLRLRLSKFPHFNAEKNKEIEHIRMTTQQRKVLRKTCAELMTTYPKAVFEDFTDDEQQFITLEEVEAAHDAYEEHHLKVIDIADQMLLELNVLLNEVKADTITVAVK